MFIPIVTFSSYLTSILHNVTAAVHALLGSWLPLTACRELYTLAIANKEKKKKKRKKEDESNKTRQFEAEAEATYRVNDSAEGIRGLRTGWKHVKQLTRSACVPEFRTHCRCGFHCRLPLSAHNNTTGGGGTTSLLRVAANMTSKKKKTKKKNENSISLAEIIKK